MSMFFEPRKEIPNLHPEKYNSSLFHCGTFPPKVFGSESPNSQHMGYMGTRVSSGGACVGGWTSFCRRVDTCCLY